MFFAIIYIAHLLTIAAEIYLYRTEVSLWRRSYKRLYYLFGIPANYLYLIFIAISRIWDIYSVAWSFVHTAAALLFLLNALWKIVHSCGMLISKSTGRHGWTVAGWFVIGLFTVLVFYGLLFERNMLRVRRVELSFDSLPEAADGVRVVQTGDIHIGQKLNRYTMLRKVVGAVNRLDADIVIDCGDLIDVRANEADSVAVALLSQIRAKRGVFSVIGNHDNGMYLTDTIKTPRKQNLEKLIALQQSAGRQVLVDSTAYLRFGSDSIAVTGLNYPANIKRGQHGGDGNADYSPVFDTLPDGIFNIAVAHTPAVWENILQCGDIELTLSGHVHSMQLKIPIGKRGWSPARFAYKHWSGLYDDEGRYLYVTDGIGSSLPVRIGTPPEITLIILRKKR